MKGGEAAAEAAFLVYGEDCGEDWGQPCIYGDKIGVSPVFRR